MSSSGKTGLPGFAGQPNSTPRQPPRASPGGEKAATRNTSAPGASSQSSWEQQQQTDDRYAACGGRPPCHAGAALTRRPFPWPAADRCTPLRYRAYGAARPTMNMGAVSRRPCQPLPFIAARAHNHLPTTQLAHATMSPINAAAARTLIGATKQQWAAALGVHPSAVSHWEHGRMPIPEQRATAMLDLVHWATCPSNQRRPTLSTRRCPACA